MFGGGCEVSSLVDLVERCLACNEIGALAKECEGGSAAEVEVMD